MKTFKEMRQAIMMSTPVVGPIKLEEGLQGADHKKISAAIKAGKTVTGKSNRDDYSNKGKEFKILKLYVTPIGIITTFKATVDWGDGPKAMDQSFIASYTISESVEEGTMRSGIFDPDIKKRKDAARKLVFFLKAKRNLRIGPMDDKQGGSNKAIDAYIKELMKYVFDDEMIDDLYPTGKNERVKANDIVVKRLKKMGVKVK